VPRPGIRPERRRRRQGGRRDAREGLPARGRRGLVATDAGLAAIGIEPEDANPAPEGATDAPTEVPATDALTGTEPASETAHHRSGTKQEAPIAMLRAEGGATIEEIAVALEWRAHTVRGAMAGAIKKNSA
jgi:hypothetical protein